MFWNVLLPSCLMVERYFRQHHVFYCRHLLLCWWVLFSITSKASLSKHSIASPNARYNQDWCHGSFSDEWGKSEIGDIFWDLKGIVLLNLMNKSLWIQLYKHRFMLSVRVFLFLSRLAGLHSPFLLLSLTLGMQSLSLLISLHIFRGSTT